MINLPQLPVSHVLADVGKALADYGRAVLSAPPGAGKTTLVPLYLLSQPWRTGKIILLEPRRLAGRAAASRMASILGESVGETVGYRMRLDTRISSKTRIEVVTEGVFARMILDDPELSGVDAVLFDEFHERSLDADFGLALALDVQGALRADLKILVMSATLDVEGVASLLGGAPVTESLGRGFPIDISYRDRPTGERIEDSMTQAILDTREREPGSILAFLPGQAEILRTVERLQGRISEDVILAPLYGNLGQKEQDAAIRPAPAGKTKIVLATSIAETSITIDGVRVVIDSGLQRLPVFEPSTGITRLETVRVSRASADQRAGRAGRTAPGIAIRLWHQGQTAALPAFTPPQILSSDLSGLLLDLVSWGVQDTRDLAFITQPPETSLSEARSLLMQLGALDEGSGLTARGRIMRGLALPPRLAAMVISAADIGHGAEAALLAVLLTEQGLGGPSLDLEDRLRRLKSERGERAESSRRLAARLVAGIGKDRPKSSTAITAGQLLLHAFPDRIALQRGGRGRFIMANGRGAELPETERMAACSMLVIADLTGRAAQPRILAAAEISRRDVEDYMPGAIQTEEQCVFDPARRQVRARRATRLGAIVFDETPLPRPVGEQSAKTLAEGLRMLGIASLRFSKDAAQLRERIGFLHRTIGDPWPDTSDEGLLSSLDIWFIPFQAEARGLDDVSASSLVNGLMSLIPPGAQRDLGRLAPMHFEAPTGQRHPIQYDGDEPMLSIRVQELFGLKIHPLVGNRIPLLLELTSPAHRAIQTTRDLPGFWAGSWKDVRAEMRGRYPRHPWPEDPANAIPTNRVKPRGT